MSHKLHYNKDQINLLYNIEIAIIFIAWFPYGLNPVRRFLESYKQYTSKSNSFCLYVILKDFPENANHIIEEYHKELNKLDKKWKTLNFNGGFDIDAYRYAATHIKCDYICFLNTNSVILTPNWIEKIISPMVNNPKIGAVGATGSYQSYVNTVFIQNKIYYDKTKNFKANFRKYKLFLKSIFYYSLHFQLFPNAHIRTNAFAIRQNDFLNLTFKPILKKYDAYRFESGRNGISQQLIKSGFIICIADKDGNTYMVDEWHKSKIYWQENQEQLIIADNQTQIYAEASQKDKQIYNRLAWGK